MNKKDWLSLLRFSLPALVFVCVFALVSAGVSALASPPPPPQDTLTVTSQADREFLEEHELTLHKLTQLAARKRSYAAQVAADTAAISSLGTKIRRGIVRQKPAADALLPAVISDVEVDDTSVPGTTTLYWNGAAEDYRNPPP